jgi:hypothetical protein
MKVDKPTRKSLPLTSRDLKDLRRLRHSTTHQAALSDLAGELVTDTSSDAAVLHAVWEAGLKAVRERVEDEGYREMAKDGDIGIGRAAARRRRPTWADDE